MNINRNKDLNSQIMKLSDGRRFGYAEYGDLNGKPVFYIHGNLGSRLEAAFVEEEKLTDLEVRLICIDRPGMGISDYQPDRKILDLPNDILELANHVGLTKKQFSILGGSGGGPYALACAFRIPSERLKSCIIVSGLGPYELDKTGMNSRGKNQLIIARHFPWVYRFLIWFMMGRKATAENRKWWEKNFQKLNKDLPLPDQEVVLNPSIVDRMIEKTIEAFKQGSKGPAHDFILYTKPWGFKLENIPKETNVFIFHGEQDVNVPVSMARTISQQLPNCNSKFYPNEGHLSVLVNNFPEICNPLF
ncbi:MAG: alpha/beta hydrolase [Candidatus Heimdallarchaeota archaeon]|nr:MAG: alpha/beta hydrolase [Candidatus Heimdallarchaeota archaeon]